jgi:colicin import membrane protein
MTQSWIAALSSKLKGCWNPPIGARDAGALVVTVGFNLLPDGSLAGTPVPVSILGVSNPQAVAATDAAVRAVAQCAPYNDIFPPEHYEQWQSILIDFDPLKMLGAG